MKADRINSTTKEKEEATSKKVGGAKMRFREKTDCNCYTGKEGQSQKVAKERGTHRGMHKDNVSQNRWLRKQKGLHFMSSCIQCGLKSIILKVSGFG